MTNTTINTRTMLDQEGILDYHPY